MAVIKAVSSKAGIGQAIDYVTKEEKTEEKLVSGLHCEAETAKEEMQATKELWEKTGGLLVPSGEFVIDIDHLSSPEEAICWRDTLFADERLRPDLSFVSPSTTGIKLLVPYRLSIKKTVEESFDEAVRFAWEYLEWKYGLKADATNADLSRACFLCHDPSARLGDRNC